MTDPERPETGSSTSSSHEGAETLAAPLAEGPGTMIGPYKLLQRLGEGGFGTVFVAQQEKPVQRTVALKIIKLGMDTRLVIARFEAERQALAMMDHPNIARVLDAGATETGRPFFVMELVRGEPIVEYCEKHTLSIHDRLVLFEQACAAVQHAHTKGIIHRDIKPSNILVAVQDGRPVAKVIDFGVAKATSARLTEKTLFTQHRQLIGTPAYMSPEQAEGSMDIDTRTDVYSLGVLLYELLTGTTPFDQDDLMSKGFAEMMRIIREVEPHKPSTRLSMLGTADTRAAVRRQIDPLRLRSLLKGDLDCIAMKCLEKERSRRYDTANALAMDVRRHLAGEPVLAAPVGAAYRVRKFVRRHRVAVGAAAMFALAVVGGVAGTAWQAIRATTQKHRAEAAERIALEQAEIARAVNDFLNNDLLAAAAPSTERGRGIDVTVREVLEEASTRIDVAGGAGGRFVGKPLVEAGIRDTIGQTFRMLGLFERAEPHITRSLALRQAHLGPEHPETLISTCNFGHILLLRGKSADAERVLRSTLEIQTRVIGPEDPETLRTMMSLCWSLNEQEKSAESQRLAERTLEIQRRVLGPDHVDTLRTMANVAGTYYRQGRYSDEERIRREVLDIHRRVQGPEHPSTLMAMYNLANTYTMMGEYAKALRLYEQCWEGRRRVLGPEHAQTLDALSSIGSVLGSQGQYAEAERIGTQVLETRRQAFGPQDNRTLESMRTLADIHIEAGKYAEAESLLVPALSGLRKSVVPNHYVLVGTRSSLIRTYIKQNRPDLARPLIVEQLQILRADAEGPEASATVLNRYASLLLTAEPADLRDAVTGFDYAQRAAAASGGADGAILGTLAIGYFLKGEHKTAVETAERALSLLPPDHAPARREVGANLALFRAAAQAGDTRSPAIVR